MSDKAPPNEFSVEIEIDALPRDGKTFHLEPDAAARAAIASRLGALGVEALIGEIRVAADKSEIAAQGVVRAVVLRECVASLEPLEERIEEQFTIDFRRGAQSEAMDADAEDIDQPEIHTGSVLDLGELLVQQLSLAMDPFPRKPDAESLADSYGRAENDNAFSILSEKFKKP